MLLCLIPSIVSVVMGLLVAVTWFLDEFKVNVKGTQGSTKGSSCITLVCIFQYLLYFFFVMHFLVGVIQKFSNFFLLSFSFSDFFM